MAVIDSFTYNGEREMLELHLSILDKQVDRFVIVEAKTTFSGHKKPLYFFSHEHLFRKWWKKIEYHVIDESYTAPEIALAESSPNTQGAAHWTREFLQKESILKALKGAQNEDIIYIGDVDEIWTPYPYIEFPAKLKLRVYAYYLDNLSDEEFWGTVVSPYGLIKDMCLNHLRSDTTIRTDEIHGWHFTSMGGTAEVRRKLNDSYTQESYNTPEVQQLLQQRVENGIDYLGRPFKYEISSKHWPIWLKKNSKSYRHLMKPV